MEEKVVIILSKEEAEDFSESWETPYDKVSHIGDAICNQIKEQLQQMKEPKKEHKTIIGSTSYMIEKVYCPKCGYQVSPKLTKCECIDCKWSGTDDELVYRATEQGGISYENHCPDCNGIKIKRLKDESVKKD